jgi:hypothetical protein
MTIMSLRRTINYDLFHYLFPYRVKNLIDYTTGLCTWCEFEMNGVLKFPPTKTAGNLNARHVYIRTLPIYKAKRERGR